jgi:predicted phage replisome organizer
VARFYWLKLKQDFFRSREMKKLRLIAGGATYTIIYLKMQLLSINKEGYLEFEKTESDISEQIALEIDEQIEDVRLTIAFLKANNLIEISEEDGLFLPNVIKSTGSETDSAERMRKLRRKNEEKCNKLTDGRHNVTEMCGDVTQRKESKRKESKIEEETYTQFDKFYSLYPKKVGKQQALKSWLKLKPDEALFNKITEAIKQQSQSDQWLKDNGQYIPYPGTWLNGRRWEDEVKGNATRYKQL